MVHLQFASFIPLCISSRFHSFSHTFTPKWTLTLKLSTLLNSSQTCIIKQRTEEKVFSINVINALISLVLTRNYRFPDKFNNWKYICTCRQRVVDTFRSVCPFSINPRAHCTSITDFSLRHFPPSHYVIYLIWLQSQTMTNQTVNSQIGVESNLWRRDYWAPFVAIPTVIFKREKGRQGIKRVEEVEYPSDLSMITAMARPVIRNDEVSERGKEEGRGWGEAQRGRMSEMVERKWANGEYWKGDEL